MELVLILENIRSAENVGSMLRTADSAGVSRVYLVGVTPAPIDRFGRDRKDIQKSALGAERSVPWESVSSIQDISERLQKEGFSLFALEQTTQSVSYTSAPKNALGKYALIVGSETDGVSKNALALASSILEIPMYGEKESLNVSVATGIALYALRESLS